MTPKNDKEKTPDGTTIIRHDTVETKLGVTPHASRFRQTREAAYERLFGKALKVSHELLPLAPHVDVYIFQRKSGDRTVHLLVTGGMSDLEMNLPRRAVDIPRRVELIFYCNEPRDEYISALRWVAHFPHDSKSWLGHGHTMPNGNPPAPFWGSKILDTLFFLPPIVEKDQTLPGLLQLDGEPVHFLWVVPLTTQECNFKLERGFGAMLDLFQQHRHPHVFEPNRQSYV
jgi:hypothetical protein